MARTTLTNHTSFERCFIYVASVEAALRSWHDDGDDDVGALAARLRTMTASWTALARGGQDHTSARIYVSALYRRAMVQTLRAIRALHNDVLAECQLDRSAPLFVHSFPKPLSAVKHLGLSSRVPVMRALLARLSAPGTPERLREAHEEPLAASLAAAEAVIAEREATERAGEANAEQAGRWRAAVNQALLGIEGALLQIAAKRGLDQAWVNAFFPVVTRRVKRAVAPQAEASAPVQ